jgi:hypothetical protein
MSEGWFLMKKKILLGLLMAALSPALFAGGSDFGTTGLIKMPDARMEEDGALRATIALDDVANIYNVTFQALPKVQATFRYSIFDPTRSRSSALDSNRDRSYGVKSQLLSESRLYPAVALGVRDIAGTGVWEGEYFVATKAFGRFDATIGLGFVIL